MRSVQRSGSAIRSVFAVYDSNGDPVLGLTNTDFTKLLSKDGVDSAIAVTVAEIGSGRYTATFTPNASGVWSVLLRNATYNKRGWQEDFDVNAHGSDIFDGASGVETNFTFRQVMRLVASIMLGKASGGPAGSIFRDLNDTKDRVTTAADENGDRSSMSYDVS